MRKAKHGLTEWEVDKAFAGFTIFTPILHAEEQLTRRRESYVFLADRKVTSSTTGVFHALWGCTVPSHRAFQK